MEERLKYWHVRCFNCDNKVDAFLKTSIAIPREYICKDCEFSIKLLYKCDIKLSELFVDGDQIVVIGCKITVI